MSRARIPARALRQSRLRAVISAAAIVYGLCACSSSEPQLARLSEDARILAFGNSLTFGTGARPEESYPAVLESLIGREVINAGVPGELSRQGLERLPKALERWQPDLLILCHGGNDLLRRKDGGDTERALRGMVQTAASSGTAVVLLGVPRVGLLLRSADFYDALAEELRIPLEAEVLPAVLGDNRLKSDPIHPNAAGYRRIAEALQALLRDTGAL